MRNFLLAILFGWLVFAVLSVPLFPERCLHCGQSGDGLHRLSTIEVIFRNWSAKPVHYECFDEWAESR